MEDSTPNPPDPPRPPQPKSRDREHPDEEEPVLSRDSELLQRERDEKAE